MYANELGHIGSGSRGVQPRSLSNPAEGRKSTKPDSHQWKKWRGHQAEETQTRHSWARPFEEVAFIHDKSGHTFSRNFCFYLYNCRHSRESDMGEICVTIQQRKSQEITRNMLIIRVSPLSALMKENQHHGVSNLLSQCTSTMHSCSCFVLWAKVASGNDYRSRRTPLSCLFSQGTGSSSHRVAESSCA